MRANPNFQREISLSCYSHLHNTHMNRLQRHKHIIFYPENVFFTPSNTSCITQKTYFSHLQIHHVSPRKCVFHTFKSFFDKNILNEISFKKLLKFYGLNLYAEKRPPAHCISIDFFKEQPILVCGMQNNETQLISLRRTSGVKNAFNHYN